MKGRCSAGGPLRMKNVGQQDAYSDMLHNMSTTSRITVTLPKEQVRHIRQKTDNVSGFIAEAVADRLRGQAIDEYLDAYQAEQGVFTEQELRDAEAALTPWTPDRQDMRAAE